MTPNGVPRATGTVFDRGCGNSESDAEDSDDERHGFEAFWV